MAPNKISLNAMGAITSAGLKKVEKKKHFSFRIGKAKNGSLGTQFPKTKEKVFSMENFQKYIEKPCSSGWTQV